METKSVLATLTSHTDYVNAVVSFYKDKNPYLATGSDDKTIKVWNLSNNSLELTLTGHSDWIWSLKIFKSKNKMCLASGGRDGTIQLWELETFRQIKTMTVPDCFPTWSFTTMYDNDEGVKYIISGDCDGRVLL